MIAQFRPGRFGLPLLLALVAITGCARTETPETAEVEAPPTEVIQKVSEEGPVRAEVTLSPVAPKLGDPLTLKLLVVAAAGVDVELPGFGEALGRFSIVDFTPRREVGADGETIATQTYRLQAPMSGRQRIPPLRIEFLDERPGRVPDGEQAMPRELLTDEIPIEIASVLPEGAVADELRPLREKLDERRKVVPAKLAGWLLAAAAVVTALVAGRAWRRHAFARRRASAFAVAIAKIHRLESRGFPGADQADAWYVELSGIVRHYLEDRYGVRAPELTTEEFLREANRSAELTPGHRELLSGFLAICDRVKFAQYVPDETESSGALETARRFLEDTKIDDAADDIALVKEDMDPDADLLVISYGIISRSAAVAVREARSQGRKVSSLVLQTLWPVPEKAIKRALHGVKKVVVPEMNMGQYVLEIERLAPAGVEVVGVCRMDTTLLSPELIITEGGLS